MYSTEFHYCRTSIQNRRVKVCPRTDQSLLDIFLSLVMAAKEMLIKNFHHF